MKEEQDNDDRVYLVKDGKQQMPVYDFIKAIDANAPINPTHNFELLKEHRLTFYDKAEQGFVEQRNVNRVKTGDFERSVFYYGWLKHELGVVEQWLSDTYPNGEMKKNKTSSANQIEILKYEQFIKTEMARVEEMANNILTDSASANMQLPQLPIGLNLNQIKRLFKLLTDKGLIADDTDESSFAWAFGGSEYPENFIRVKWTASSKQSLRELISFYISPITNQMEREVTQLFLYADKPMVLGKPKGYSASYVVIEKIVEQSKENSDHPTG